MQRCIENQSQTAKMKLSTLLFSQKSSYWMIDWVLDSGNKTGAKGDYFRKKQVKTPTQPEYYSIQTP